MPKFTVKLEKAASRNGGDKYVGKIGEDDVQFYIPQSISRPAGTPKNSLNIEITVD